jgi:multiple sugar transport system permease protein
MMMAVATLTLLPVLLIFFICQRYFIEGIKMSGLKA